jgi:tRNA_anti-like
MNKSNLPVSRCGFLILVAIVSCAPTLAQHAGDSLGGTFNDPAGATITKTITDRIAQRNRERKLAARRSGASPTGRTSPSNSAPPVANINESSVLFRSTGTQLKTREIANLIDAGNPQVLKLLTVLLDEFDKGARAAGHPNDLALALSFFLATNASVYHDGGQPADPPMVELRNTIAEALVEGNALSGVTDRKKQEMYETLVIFTGFALATYEEGKQSGNVDTVKVSRQLAGQNLLALIGISPDKITFTDQAGLGIETEPATATAMAPQSSVEPASPQDAPSVTVNAGKLVIDFEGNEVRANQMYGGKRIRVNGTVNSIDILKDGRITLTFHSPAMGYAQTRCYFNKSQSSRLAQLSGGQEAVVEGTVRGLGGGIGGKGYVEVENCIVP